MRAWEITAAGGVIIFLMSLGGIFWVGYFHEIVRSNASRMEITGTIARAAGSTLEPDEIFRIIVGEIRKVIPCDYCSIASIDESTKRITQRHTNSDVKLAHLSEEDSSRRGAWIYQNVYKTKSLICLWDINDENTMLSRLFQESKIRSLLIVPILQNSMCVAHISLYSKSAHAFSSEGKSLLVTIADQISPAIQNASLYKVSSERSVRLDTMRKLNEQINENLNLQKVLNSFVKAVTELLRCDFVQIYIADQKNGILNARCWGGSVPVPPPRYDGRTGFPIKNSVGGKVFETGIPTILSDVQKIPSWAEKEWVQRVGLHSFISQPLRHGGESIGIINCMARAINYFSQDDLEFLSGLASQATIAIANAKLYEEDKRRASRLETLQSLSGKLNENLGLADLLAEVSKGSAELLGATRVVVITLENNTPEILYIHGLSLAYSKALLENYKDTNFSEAMKRMKPVAIPNVFSSDYSLPYRLALEEGIGALLNIPLIYKGSSFGVLGLYWDTARDFSPVDIGLAQAFGDHAASAVQNARLHGEAQRSRNFFRSIMDDNADAMMIADENQKIIRWNSAAERLYGFSEAEMLGQSIEYLIPDDSGDDLQVGENIQKFGNYMTFDSIRLKKDGTRFPVSISVSPVRNEQGHVIASCGIHKDLSNRRMEEKELRQAKEAAEAAANTKSEFLAKMSHEIRTPMNGVIGLTKLLLNTGLTDQQRLYAETISGSADGLLRVINDT